ncbi:MAG: hypothetical protein ACRYF3_09845 [Janthinobacterium lividum]
MRWENLFDDLEGRIVHERRQELAAEVADRRLRDVASTTLVERLIAAREEPAAEVGVQLLDSSWVTGLVRDVGPGWVLVAGARQVLVPLTSVALIRGLPARSGAAASAVAARHTLVFALRALAEGDESVLVRTAAGDLRGRLGRVGADHVDVASGPAGSLSVPFSTVLSVAELA